MPALRPLLAGTAAALLLTACTGAAPAARPAPTPAAAPFSYLALGDSVAAGVGARVPRTGGYVPRLTALLRVGLGCDEDGPCPLTDRDLAVSGATTATVRESQLPALRALLAARPAPRPYAWSR